MSSVYASSSQQRYIDVLRAVTRAEGLRPVLDEIVESATRLCAGTMSHWLLEDGLFHAAARIGVPGDVRVQTSSTLT